MTRTAKFRLQDKFVNAPLNHKKCKSVWTIPTTHLGEAVQRMANFAAQLQEPAEFLSPTASFTKPTGGYPKPVRPYVPDIWLHGQVVDHHKKMPTYHPILTTDYFECGASTHHLEHDECTLKIGDAVLGLEIE